MKNIITFRKLVSLILCLCFSIQSPLLVWAEDGDADAEESVGGSIAVGEAQGAIAIDENIQFVAMLFSQLNTLLEGSHLGFEVEFNANIPDRLRRITLRQSDGRSTRYLELQANWEKDQNDSHRFSHFSIKGETRDVAITLNQDLEKVIEMARGYVTHKPREIFENPKAAIDFLLLPKVQESMVDAINRIQESNRNYIYKQKQKLESKIDEHLAKHYIFDRKRDFVDKTEIAESVGLGVFVGSLYTYTLFAIAQEKAYQAGTTFWASSDLLANLVNQVSFIGVGIGLFGVTLMNLSLTPLSRILGGAAANKVVNSIIRTFHKDANEIKFGFWEEHHDRLTWENEVENLSSLQLSQQKMLRKVKRALIYGHHSQLHSREDIEEEFTREMTLSYLQGFFSYLQHLGFSVDSNTGNGNLIEGSLTLSHPYLLPKKFLKITFGKTNRDAFGVRESNNIIDSVKVFEGKYKRKILDIPVDRLSQVFETIQSEFSSLKEFNSFGAPQHSYVTQPAFQNYSNRVELFKDLSEKSHQAFLQFAHEFYSQFTLPLMNYIDDQANQSVSQRLKTFYKHRHDQMTKIAVGTAAVVLSKISGLELESMAAATASLSLFSAYALAGANLLNLKKLSQLDNYKRERMSSRKDADRIFNQGRPHFSMCRALLQGNNS